MAFSGAWKAFQRFAGDDITIIAPDMPSHGRSPDWDEVSDFSDTVYQASLSCLTEPMDLIGHSFGGVTALRLAIEHPELVRSLTMIEPVFFCAARQTAAEAVTSHNAAAKPFFDALLAGNREDGARLFNRMWSADAPRWAVLPEQVRAAMTRAVHVVPDTHDFLFEDTANLMARLDHASMPAMLVRGATSPEIIAATNAEIARGLPNATEVAMDGAGHMAPISHPKDMAAVWSDFIRDVPV
jgi:pimeloyl-ACP methyl ester carboxylesterase